MKSSAKISWVLFAALTCANPAFAESITVPDSAATEPESKAAILAASEPAAKTATDAATQPATKASTSVATEPASKASAPAATEPATKASAPAATEPAAKASAPAATEPADKASAPAATEPADKASAPAVTEPATKASAVASEPASKASEPAAATEPMAAALPAPIPTLPPKLPSHAMCNTSDLDEGKAQLVKTIAKLRQQHVIFDKANCVTNDSKKPEYCGMEEAFTDAQIAWESFVERTCAYHALDFDYYSACAKALPTIPKPYPDKEKLVQYPNHDDMMRICKANLLSQRLAELRADLSRLSEENAKYHTKKKEE